MNWRRAVAAMGLLVVSPPGATAQRGSDAGPYFDVVAGFFGVGSAEVRILREWRVSDDEIPVVLFVARRAGVSADVVAAERRRGTSWRELARRYGIPTSSLLVEFQSRAAMGSLGPLYGRIESTPRGSWDEVSITDGDIVSLINVRVLSTELEVPPGRVLAAARDAGSFAAAVRLLAGG